MTVAYLGGGFHGFALQTSGVPTVAGALVDAIKRVTGSMIEPTVAGRTDAGVHGWGQVVSFDLPADVDLPALQRSLNKLLGPAVVVRSLEAAPVGFDARRWAVARSYRYLVVNRPVPDPFLAHMAWHIEEPLDVRAMQLACDPLIGEHDFTSFCKKPPASTIGAPPSMVRRVLDARWVELPDDGVLRFQIEASAFCHQMVRSIVGTLVAVGRGKKRAGEIAGILRAQDRSLAASPAPAHGLTLWSVTYGDGPTPPARR